MYLRKLQEIDIPFMLEWMHDRNINQNFIADFSSYDEAKVSDFITNSFSEAHRHYACVADNDEYLGTVSLKNIDNGNRNAEYAISFRACAHGTGASYYATQEILRIAFDEMKLEKVYLNVASSNIKANRFYQKYGFFYEGMFRKHIKLKGQLEDLKWYSILVEEYLERRNNNNE